MVSKRAEEGDLFPRGAAKNSTPRIRKRNGEILFGPETKRPRETRQPTEESLAAKDSTVARAGTALTYKRVTPGMTVLALVVRATRESVEFILPGGLRAVAIDDTLLSPSETIGNRPALDVHTAGRDDEEVTSDDASSDDESDEEMDDTNAVNPLWSVVEVGQILPVAVSEREVTHRHRTYVAVSLKPDLVNYGLNPAHLLSKKFPTFAVVRSVEDHGYILTFGSKIKNTGFLPFGKAPAQAAPTGTDGRDDADSADEDDDKEKNRAMLTVGTPLCVITRKDITRKKKLVAASAPIRVSARSADVLPTAVDVLESATFQDIRAGMLLRARVMTIGPGGVSLLALGVFPVSVDAAHVTRKPDGSFDTEKDKTVSIRVLYADATVKLIVGSMLNSFVTEMKPPLVPDFVKVGTLLNNLEVESVKNNYGLILRQGEDQTGNDRQAADGADGEDRTDGEMDMTDTLSNDGDGAHSQPPVTIPIFVHIKHIEDGKQPALESYHPKMPIQSGGRVVFISKFDGQVSVDLRKSMLSRKAVTIEEVEGGTVYKCRVVRHTISGGLVVAIEGDEHLIGVVPQHQLSDVRIPSARLGKHSTYSIGSSLKCRVLTVRLDTKKCYLTTRASLLSPKYPILTSVEDTAKALREIQPGKSNQPSRQNIYTGSVSHITETGGVIVRFCNGIAGLVPRHELCMSEDSGNVGDAYPEGETVSVRVTGVDMTRGRLRLSMNLKATTTSGNRTTGRSTPTPVNKSRSHEAEDHSKNRRDQLASSLKVMASQNKSTMIGMEIPGKIFATFNSHANVAIGPGCIGYLHVSNTSHIDEKTLRKIPSGLAPDEIAEKFALPECGSTKKMFAVELSRTTREENEVLLFDLSLDERICKPPALKVGAKVVGVVQNLSSRHRQNESSDDDGHMFTTVTIGRGRLVYCHDNECLPASRSSLLNVGSLVICRITSISGKDSTNLRGSLSDNGIIRDEPFTTVVTNVMPGRGLLVAIPPLARDNEAHGIGFVDMCDISDDFDSAAALISTLKTGDEVEVRRVKSRKEDTSETEGMKLTMRSGKDVKDKLLLPEDLDSLKEGTTLRGFIKNLSNFGCFVNIGREVCAHVKLCNLHDDFVRNPKEEFPQGRLVSGKVESVQDVKGKKQVSFTLRKRARKDLMGNSSARDLKEGMVREGKVKKLDRWGCVVELSKGVSGVLHVTEADQDRVIQEPWDEWMIGQWIKVVVIRVGYKVGFGTKRCYFEAAGLSEDAIDDVLEKNFEAKSKVGEQNEPNAVIDLDVEKPVPVSERVIEVESDGGADEEVATTGDGDDPAHGGEEPSLDNNDGMDVEPTVPALKVSQKFDFADNPKPQADPKEEQIHEEEDTKREEVKKTSKDKREKKRLREAAENEIQLREEALARDEDSPETAEDFERMLIAEPNTSVLWIRYMASCLQISQVEKARSIAERALETIKLEKEVDRTNVWVAYINLEAGFGGMNDAKDGSNMKEDVKRNAAVFRVFDRGCERITDVKNFHLQVAAALRSSQPNLADEILRRATRKFKHSKKVWIAMGQTQFAAGNVKDARRTLDRALGATEEEKHVLLITKFAQLEYQFGSSERGRTVFESIAGNLPKRVDLWNIYLDMEIGLCKRCEGDDQKLAVERTRRLFERFTKLELSVKKIKFGFKKWQEFEKTFGESKDRKLVKIRAQAWVDKALSSKKES